ncbi:MAG: hypothetical protein JSS24_06580 [Proteobacteria bacterium]|nr:hypothetical protein [Pseudomonadota bacterium]
MGFGDLVEVLGPASLRASLSATLRHAASTYDADSGDVS